MDESDTLKMELFELSNLCSEQHQQIASLLSEDMPVPGLLRTPRETLRINTSASPEPPKLSVVSAAGHTPVFGTLSSSFKMKMPHSQHPGTLSNLGASTRSLMTPGAGAAQGKRDSVTSHSSALSDARALSAGSVAQRRKRTISVFSIRMHNQMTPMLANNTTLNSLDQALQELPRQSIHDSMGFADQFYAEDEEESELGLDDVDDVQELTEQIRMEVKQELEQEMEERVARRYELEAMKLHAEHREALRLKDVEIELLGRAAKRLARMSKSNAELAVAVTESDQKTDERLDVYDYDDVDSASLSGDGVSDRSRSMKGVKKELGLWDRLLLPFQCFPMDDNDEI